jgi:hypothetical protein
MLRAANPGVLDVCKEIACPRFTVPALSDLPQGTPRAGA